MRLRNLSIRRKLVLLTGALCLITGFLCTVGFTTHHLRFARASSAERLESLAQLLAAESVTPIGSNDKERGGQLLSGLTGQADIEFAAIYDADGRLFADYRVAGQSPRRGDCSTDDLRETTFQRTNDNRLNLFHPITTADRLVGVVHLRANQSSVSSQSYHQMRLAFVVLFLSVGVSFLLCGVLERFISAPITGLTEVARSISEGGDYSLRASHSPRTDSDSGDEIDELYSAFNEMLEQVATVGRPDPDDAPELDTISHRQSDNLAPTKPHVLIIDDKPVNRKLLGWILENAGYTIECAECGQVGLEQSDAGFSLILVETQLQDMDACSFAEQLRLKGCEVPTIALISQSTAPNAYLDAGFSDCIAKPFRPEALLTCVARWAASDTPDEFSRSRSESWVVRRTFETPS